MSATVLSLEFNELVPSIMDRFIDEGRVPHFKALYDSSEVFITDARTTVPEQLEPWIQWVTVHTGADYDEHGILQLSEGDKYSGKRIWDVVSDAGQPSWVCGSMNVHCTRTPRGAILPDPWSGHGMGPLPAELAPFYEFVRSNVQEHTSRKPKMGRKELLAFAKFMLTHGLSFSTVWSIGRQLVRERFGNHRWRRATILDQLQADVFEWYYRKLRPAFSTFFINSCAFLQHRYWRNYDPSAFKVKPTAQEQQDYGEAVLFGYQQLDAIVGRLMRLVGPETTIIFSTALSQQPHLAHEETGGKLSYRPHDYAAFLNAVGIAGFTGVEPVMVGQFHVRFRNRSEAEAAEARLNSLQVIGQQALKAYRDGDSVFAGCLVNQKVQRDAWLEIPATNERWPFYDLIFQIDLVKSGRHHPAGMLWVRTPGGRHHVHDEHVSLCAIAPTILSILGLATPPEMRASVLVGPGRSLSEIGTARIPNIRMQLTSLNQPRCDAGPAAEPVSVVHLVLALNIGGLEKVAYDLVRFADSAQFSVRVLCLGEVGALGGDFEKLGVPVERFGLGQHETLRGIFLVARRLRELRPDVLHTHNAGPHIVGAPAAWFAGVPAVVHTRHGMHTINGWKMALANRLATRLTHRMVAVSIAAGQAARDVDRVPESRLDIIRNGVDLNLYRRYDEKAVHRTCKAIHAARLTYPIKDQRTLLRAVRLVVDREPDFTLDLVGDGPDRPALEALCDELQLRSHVNFLGFRHDVHALLPGADLFVLSSTTEGLPMTILEAMAAGLPVVSTDVGGISELVKHNETGLLVRPQSPEALACAILELVRDRHRAGNMGAGRRQVEEEFDIRVVTARYEELYRTLLRENRFYL